jgi:hypothetical protein
MMFEVAPSFLSEFLRILNSLLHLVIKLYLLIANNFILNSKKYISSILRSSLLKMFRGNVKRSLVKPAFAKT